MTASKHRRLAVFLPFIAFIAPFAFAILVPSQSVKLLRWVLDMLAPAPPLAGGIVFFILAGAYVLGPALLASWAAYTLVPARCEKCDGRTFRYNDRGKRVSVMQTQGKVRYWCPSCGHTEDLGWIDTN